MAELSEFIKPFGSHKQYPPYSSYLKYSNVIMILGWLWLYCITILLFMNSKEIFPPNTTAANLL